MAESEAECGGDGGGPGAEVLAEWAADGQRAFEDGVWYALNAWSALMMAVENGWAGRDGEAKLDNLYNELLDLFEHRGDALDRDALEPFLTEAVGSDFNLVVEDGSVPWIAELLLTLRRDTLEGRLDGLVTLWKRAEHEDPAAAAELKLVEEEEEEDGEDGEEEEKEDGGDQQGDGEGDREEVEEAAAAVEADDGWTTVVSKKDKKKKNR